MLIYNVGHLDLFDSWCVICDGLKSYHMNYQNFRNFYPQDHQPIFLLFDVLKYCFIWALSGVHKVLLWCLCRVYVVFMGLDESSRCGCKSSRCWRLKAADVSDQSSRCQAQSSRCQVKAADVRSKQPMSGQSSRYTAKSSRSFGVKQPMSIKFWIFGWVPAFQRTWLGNQPGWVKGKGLEGQVKG